MSVLAAGFPALARAQAGYTLTASGLGMQPERINSLGHIVGSGSSAGSTTQNLGLVYDGTSVHQACSLTNAAAINGTDVIVGAANFKVKGNLEQHAARCVGTTMTDVSPAGSHTSAATDINSSGQIVGWYTTASGANHAFLYANGKASDLGTVAGASDSTASFINTSGQVVGSSGGHLFLYTGGLMHDLDTPSGYTGAAPKGFNDNGDIVLQADNGINPGVPTPSHPFLYRGGIFIDLGVPAGAQSAVVTGVSNRGEIAGFFKAADGNDHGAIVREGQWLDLNTLVPPNSGWNLNEAEAIADSGQIAVFALPALGGQWQTVRLDESLLFRYAPQLRLDSTENYFPDSAAEITDNYVSGQYTNQLLDQYQVTIAASDPTLGYPALSLSYLGATYPGVPPGGNTAQSGDHIDEANSYSTDEARMHQNPAYANTVYGRQLAGPNGETLLQYWFFYYYNSHPFDNHEGDWEMIQLHLDSSGNPIRAAYSQHNGGERCDWVHVPRTSSGRPVVYVAVGSHASYFSSGTHIWDAGAAFDDTDGNDPIDPAVIDVTSPPSWLMWPGIWGGSGASPSGPNKHDSQWNYALDWENGVSGCTEGQTFFSHTDTTASTHVRGLPTPPTPVITARQVGHRVVMSYSFATLPTGARAPWQFRLAVKSLDAMDSPALARWVPISQRSGHATQDVSVLHGRLIVLARVYTRSGGHTKLLRVPVHRQ